MKMNKLLFTSVVMLSVLLSFGQQSLSVSGYAIDSSFSSLSNQPVWVNLYSYGNFVSQQKVYSNSNGYYNYVVPAQASSTIEVMTNDCSGRFYSNSYVVTPSDTSFNDTLLIGCSGLPAFNCSGGFVNQYIGNNVFYFRDTTSINAIPNAVEMRYWTFGDGASLTTYDVDSVNHTYGSTGQYTVCMIRNVLDTTKRILYCEDTVCVSLVINPASTGFCTASFSVDTQASGGASLVVYNNSTPAHNNTAYTTSYSWDFGDGNTSANPFPTYYYTNAGVYPICLTITSVDAQQNVCVDTFCDTLGVDSLGNVLYKNGSAGFALIVLNPAGMVGVDEIESSPTWEVYPNPTRSVVNVHWSNWKDEKLVHWRMINSNGMIVLEGVENSESKYFKINVEPLSNGIYQLQILSGKEISNTKLMVY